MIVLTDHENLTHYRHPQKINQHVARYLHTLADFNLELQHIPGTANKADALSQCPDHNDGSQDNKEVVALPDSLFVRSLDLTVFDEEVKRKQKANQETYEQWKEKYQCDEKEDALYHHKALVVMDNQAHQKILRHYHDSLTAGHPGV